MKIHDTYFLSHPSRFSYIKNIYFFMHTFTGLHKKLDQLITCFFVQKICFIIHKDCNQFDLI